KATTPHRWRSKRSSKKRPLPEDTDWRVGRTISLPHAPACWPPSAAAGRRHGDAEPDRAGDARAAEAAVAAGVLGKVLLVVVLGVIEPIPARPGRVELGDLRRDRPVTGRREHLLIGLQRGLRGAALLIVAVQDQRAVLRTDVVALAHPLRRVVPLPEDLEHLLVAGGRGVEGDEHDLGVAGPRAADLLIG